MEKVSLDQKGAVLRLTLNDPDTLNAIGAQMANELRDAVRFAAEQQGTARCLLITGTGRGFCSGGNVGWIDENRNNPESGGATDHGVRLGTHHHYVLKLLMDLPYPIVTAINGPAAGIGFAYALAGDMIAAAKSAFFVAAFRNLGVSPDGGLSWLLPRIVGWARAKELLLMGQRLSAEQALDWGLVTRVYDDVDFSHHAMKLAEEIADGPTVALGEIRRLARAAWDNSYAQQLDLEESVQPATFGTADAAEGARAMLENRRPEFRGR